MPLIAALTERHESERAAFTVVTRSQQQPDIFEGHDNDERPEDERQNTEYNVALG